MKKAIVDALKAEMPKVLRWEFPVAVVEFGDRDCETEAFPEAHLTDVSWSERGREYTVLALLSEDEVHEVLSEAAIAGAQREIDELVAYVNKRV